MEKIENVTVEVLVHTEKAVEQVARLNELLVSANSLVQELADTLVNLNLDIKIYDNKESGMKD